MLSLLGLNHLPNRAVSYFEEPTIILRIRIKLIYANLNVVSLSPIYCTSWYANEKEVLLSASYSIIVIKHVCKLNR